MKVRILKKPKLLRHLGFRNYVLLFVGGFGLPALFFAIQLEKTDPADTKTRIMVDVAKVDNFKMTNSRVEGVDTLIRAYEATNIDFSNDTIIGRVAGSGHLLIDVAGSVFSILLAQVISWLWAEFLSLPNQQPRRHPTSRRTR